MPRVEFEPTILMSEREKTVHALDRAVIVIGTQLLYIRKKKDEVVQVAFHEGIWGDGTAATTIPNLGTRCPGRSAHRERGDGACRIER
jgi:hypothetical protein